jgi:carbonic anhydrase
MFRSTFITPTSAKCTRRSFFDDCTLSAALLWFPSATHAARQVTSGASPSVPDQPASAEALRRLIEGNKRFAAGMSQHPGRTPADFRRLATAQTPIAIIIACADSRVSPEILFDAGIGDLFVIRVAGNYVSGAGSSLKGSVEYAVLELAVPLIMVVGHSSCGALKAAIKHIRDHDALPGSIDDLVNNIKPAVLESEAQPGDLLENSTRANVRRSVQRLKALDPVIGPKVKAGTVEVVGGVYDLGTGKITLL